MKTIAIIGATGNVGRKIIEIILDKELASPQQLQLFASARSAGTTLPVREHSFQVHDMKNCHFHKGTIYLFATESEISQIYVPQAIAAGGIVVDTSSCYRFDAKVPLIVAPVNKKAIHIAEHPLYAVANCVASPISTVLSPLDRHFGVKRVAISTYQSTSGAGKGAMDELYHETHSHYTQQPYTRQHFKKPIAFNIIPQVGKFLEDGSTHEEFKIIKEIQKILSSDIAVAATSVRVPVMIGHSASLSIELKSDFSLEEIRKQLAHAPGISLSSDHFTTPIEVVGSDAVHVGRIRKDGSVAHGLQLWVCSDNLRRGAALDTVEILEEILLQSKN